MYLYFIEERESTCQYTQATGHWESKRYEKLSSRAKSLNPKNGSGLFASSLKTLRTGSFKLFKRPLPGFLTILTL